MNKTFTAIDFETATGNKWSICQIGLVRVEDGVISKKISLLIQPPYNFYTDFNIGVHGITPDKTKNAPTFKDAWYSIEQYIKDQNVVAHNGFRFDFECLKKTLEFYKIKMPAYTGHCTYKLFKSNLATLCREYNIPLNHHEALSDALACAELFKIYNEKVK